MEIFAAFKQAFGRAPRFEVTAPGRVNLLGEHVDYNEGPVLPVAIDRAVHLVLAPAEDRTVRLSALDMNAQVAFSLDNLAAKQDLDGRPLPHWALYPAGVASAIQAAGFPTSGLVGMYDSAVPVGAGLSSSAAVQVAFACAWQALDGWKSTRMELVRLCQKAENDYLGLASGLMDQFASAHGVRDHALYLDTRSLEWEPVQLPKGTAIVVADSSMRRTLANSAYNERRAACEQAVEILRKYMPDIRSLRDVSPPELAAYSEFLPEEVARRAEHVVKEIARVASAVSALHRDDRRAFGALMFAGHASLRDLYEVSTPELDALVQIARKLPGCIGARLTGAGFGGCTVNLVEEDKAAAFISSLKDSYRQQTGKEAQVYLCKASEGAMVKEIS